MSRSLLTAALLGPALLAPTGAFAQPTVTPCLDAGGLDGMANIVEPWSDAVREYANGAVKLVHVDTAGEPVCCSSHVVVLVPWVHDGPGGRDCFVVSDGPSLTGFLDVSMREAASSYDPARGLLVSVPVQRYDGVQGPDPARAERIGLRINQATGEVTVE